MLTPSRKAGKQDKPPGSASSNVRYGTKSSLFRLLRSTEHTGSPKAESSNAPHTPSRHGKGRETNIVGDAAAAAASTESVATDRDDIEPTREWVLKKRLETYNKLTGEDFVPDVVPPHSHPRHHTGKQGILRRAANFLRRSRSLSATPGPSLDPYRLLAPPPGTAGPAASIMTTTTRGGGSSTNQGRHYGGDDNQSGARNGNNMFPKPSRNGNGNGSGTVDGEDTNNRSVRGRVFVEPFFDSHKIDTDVRVELEQINRKMSQILEKLENTDTDAKLEHIKRRVSQISDTVRRIDSEQAHYGVSTTRKLDRVRERMRQLAINQHLSRLRVENLHANFGHRARFSDLNRSNPTYVAAAGCIDRMNVFADARADATDHVDINGGGPATISDEYASAALSVELPMAHHNVDVDANAAAGVTSSFSNGGPNQNPPDADTASHVDTPNANTNHVSVWYEDDSNEDEDDARTSGRSSVNYDADYAQDI